MYSDNKIAKVVGALFIVTMFLGMIDAYTVAPMLDAPLQSYYLYESRFLIGAFSIFLMSLGVVGIAILFYPILQRYNQIIALVYLSSRVMESLLLIIGAITYFLLLTLSHELAHTGVPDPSYFQSLADLLVEARYSGYQVAMMILGIASLLLCYLLYQTRLIPRSIAIIGFIGYALVLLSAPLDILGVIDTTGSGGILYLPGALFELFLLPFWLIAKGFNPSSAVSTST